MLPILGDANNAGSQNPYGLTFAGMNELNEAVIGGFVQETWFAETLIDRISTQGIPELKNGGWQAKFHRLPEATVSDYVIGKDLVYAGLFGFPEVTIELDRAAYGTYTMHDLQRAIQNKAVASYEAIFQHMGKSIGRQLEQKQYNALMAFIKAGLLATAEMANGSAQVGLFHKGAPKTNTEIATGAWKPDTGYKNIMDIFRKARIRRTRMNVPKEADIFALCAPEVMDMAAHMEKVHYTVGSTNDADRVTRGQSGDLMLSGFTMIECPWIERETVSTQADQHAVFFGAKQGLAFHRVLDKSETVRLEKDFAEAFRQLSAYGFDWLDKRYWGLDYVRIPA